MKYYKKELWRNMNSSEVGQRIQAEQSWKTADEEYAKYFDGIKKSLPRSFTETFSRHGGFHDYLVQSFSFVSGKRSRKFEIMLISSPYAIQLSLHDVAKVQCDISNFSSCICGQLHWGYSEIEILPDKQVEVRILFDPENEMLIDCGKISCAVKLAE